MKRRTEIIFEVEETRAGRCPRCRADVPLVAPSLPARVAGQSERRVFRRIEAGRAHFVEGERTLVCALAADGDERRRGR